MLRMFTIQLIATLCFLGTAEQNVMESLSQTHKDVLTESGAVRGHVATDGDYFAFLGIPYATPPTGSNRFKAPSPPSSWNGTYEANREVVCPQRGVGNEDCLVANVFTPPNAQAHDQLPVFVYIHGGSFQFGSGPIKGVEPLIKHNIIVVTFNYRLGALGFLCLGVQEAPGNAGLKDQVAALKWIKNNIGNFGGDPNNLTLYGMSAGAAAVELHMISRASRNLFHRAIIESASSTSVWVIDKNPLATARSLPETLNITATEHLYKIINFYQNVPADALSTISFEYYTNLTDGTFGFVPCLERELDGVDAFVTEAPEDMLSKGQFHKMPTIFMFASSEGLFLRSEDYHSLNYKERVRNNFIEFLPADLIFDSESRRIDTAEKIKQFYFDNNSISDDTIEQYLNYFGDSLVLYRLLNSVKYHRRRGNDVYLMEFTYKGDMGGCDQFYKNVTVAGHGDVIKHIILNKPIRNESDREAVSRMAALVSNFAKYGNPTPRPTELLPALWPPAGRNDITYLLFDTHFQILKNPHRQRIEFWDQLYKEFGNTDKVRPCGSCRASCKCC